MKALREEIDAVLRGKLDTAIKEVQAQREQDLDELVALKKAIEGLEAERESIQKEMGTLNTRKASDLGKHNRLTQKLSSLNRQVNGRKNAPGKQGQVDALMTRLTEIDIDPKTLTLVLYFKGVKDA